MAVVSLQKLRENNKSFSSDNRAGISVSKEDRKDTYLKDKDQLAKTVQALRSETRSDAAGNRIGPSIKSFTQILEEMYNMYVPKEVKEADPYAVVRNYLKEMGVNAYNFSLSSLSQALGGPTLESTKDLLELLDTKIADGTTFVIQEVFNEAIRLGILGNAFHTQWTAKRSPMGRIKTTSPQLLKGDAAWRFLGEGESIEMGTVQFGQKEIVVRKVGTGIEMTDELVFESPIDMLAEYLMTVGEDMSLAKDALALVTLQNGEQADLSESSPIIGSESGTGFAWIDLVRVLTRTNRLKHNMQTIITKEGEGIDLSLLAEFKGFDGVRMLSSLSSVATQIPNFNHTVHGLMGAEHVMFVDKNRCMQELAYKPLKTEKRRNPKRQVDEFYVSDWVGFSIIRRDARVQVKRDTAFSGQGFPAWMDVDAYQNVVFDEE